MKRWVHLHEVEPEYRVTAKPWTKEWHRQYFLAVWYGVAHKKRKARHWRCLFWHKSKKLLAPVIVYVKFQDEPEPRRGVLYREVGRFCIRCHARKYDEQTAVREPPPRPDGHRSKSVLGDAHRRDLDS